jgi:fumarate hydratase subunit alpha
MTREINSSEITKTVKKLAIEAATELPEDVLDALNKALAQEKSNSAREILRQLIKNAELARSEKLPLCQDTGYAIVFIEIGEDVHISGRDLVSAINEGVREGYEEGFLRKSIVSDPFKRKNTGDNTPADIITELVPGSEIKITFMAKGGGCENVSAFKVFTPNTDFSEIAKFAVEKVIEAGPNACPPVIVGLGIGGTADKAMLIAKKALLRDIGRHHSNKDIAKMEKELLKMINDTGVGPSGLGGNTTALAANIETFPAHIASLPVAVAIDCHAHRIKRAKI